MTSTFSASGWAAIELVGDHLWQSTIFLAGAALLAWVLRHHRAQVRHWLWLAASVKFLVPCAALVAIGEQLGWILPATAVPAQAPFVVMAVDAIGQPFSSQQFFPVVGSPPTPASLEPAATVSMLLFAIWSCGAIAMLLRWWVRWRRVAMVVRASTPIRDGRAWEALRRLEARGGITRPTPFVSSDAPLAPGVFGILRPVLLWPRRITGRLGPDQVQAILAHELAHVRWRDNLAAALHMVVEAMFWFHPLVWWVGGRLVDERERACDDAVLRLGTEPSAYAESILRTCRFSVESPIVCMASVTGSDLKKRIEHIMTNDTATVLTVGWKLLLTTVAITAIAGPLAIGVLSAPRLTVAGIIHQRSVQVEQLADNHTRLTGAVELDGGVWQFYADEVDVFTDESRLVATGNVVFTADGGRIAADRVEFDVDGETGVFYNARGAAVPVDNVEHSMCGTHMRFAEAKMEFWGELIEKVGPRTYRLTRGGFTSCVQPTARWQVNSSVTINLDEYALHIPPFRR